MGAFLDGIPFRVNPTSVSWPYSIKLSTTKTMGGKVVQIYGISMGDLVIEGTFGAGGPEEQQAFFNRLIAIIESQMPVSATSVPRPVRFHWPERGWDFWCYVRSIVQPNASTSIRASNEDFNPGYRLTLFVQEDNGDLVRVARNSAQAAYIARLSAGLGWRPSADWNGPLSLNDSLEGDTVLDDLFDRRTAAVTDTVTRSAQSIADLIREELL